MNAHELVREIQSLGIELRVEGAAIRYRPKEAMPHQLIRHLEEEKTEVLAVLTAAHDAEVSWRYEVMRQQVPLTGALPFLLARPELRDRWRELGRTLCHSCGDALPEGHVVGIAPRCPWCQQAAELACATVRGGGGGTHEAASGMVAEGHTATDAATGTDGRTEEEGKVAAAAAMPPTEREASLEAVGTPSGDSASRPVDGWQSPLAVRLAELLAAGMDEEQALGRALAEQAAHHAQQCGFDPWMPDEPDEEGVSVLRCFLCGRLAPPDLQRAHLAAGKKVGAAREERH